MFLLPEKARVDLELPRLWAGIAASCRTPMGRRRALAWDVPPEHDETMARLARGREALDLQNRGEPLPVGGTDDVGEALGRLAAYGVLAGPELLALTGVLAQARAVRKYLATRTERAPALGAVLSSDPTLDPVQDEVRRAFDTDGLLADHASPRLAELRGEVRTLRARLSNRLTEITQRYGAIMQDDFVTEREGRIVVPVRSDAHERFPGIVHATSSSGATLFVEPRVLVPMGNRLKVLEGEVLREEIAIYTQLSALLSDRLPSVSRAVEIVAEADVLRAVSELAGEYRLRFPDIVPDAKIELFGARHPLLVFEKVNVIPSDLAVGTGHAMILSGPNAGGKTVALKTLGLCATMVRSGLPIPCGDGSSLGLFDAVLTDVGDDQSLQKNLSTFSAHVKNLVGLLEDSGPRALVLLDELAGGTDPREGEALAAGVLASLTARGAAVVCTTHYEGLKHLALGDPRFSNASVGFDTDTLRPTFQLIVGVPGSSSALAVARQFGMPSTVLDRASSFLNRDDRTFEELVAKMHAERQGLEQARLDYEAKARDAEAERLGLEEERSRLTAREVTAANRDLRELREGIRRAQEVLREARAALRQKPKDPSDLRKIERDLERAGQGVNSHAAALEPAPEQGEALGAGDLKRGTKVYLARLRKEVTVLEIEGTTVRVAAGALKLTVQAAELSKKPHGDDKPDLGFRKPKSSAQPAPTQARLDVAIQTSTNTCDLRGLRVDEAIGMTGAFLDRAFGSGERVVFLVHGHGTGALRDALRAELAAHTQVASFRAGGPGEGGDGATLVWFD